MKPRASSKVRAPRWYVRTLPSAPLTCTTPSLGILTWSGSTSCSSQISGCALPAVPGGVSATIRCPCFGAVSWVMRRNDAETTCGSTNGSRTGSGPTRICMICGYGTPGAAFSSRTRRPRSRPKSTSRSIRSAGATDSGSSTGTGRGSSPPSEPICHAAPRTCSPVASSTSRSWKVRALAALSSRKRYQRADTSRCGQMTPLTSVYGPANGTVTFLSAASFPTTTVLCSSRPVSRPSASWSRLRSWMISGISYSPAGSRSARSSSSRTRYRPASPEKTFHRVMSMAWSWYHHVVARWSFGYSVSWLSPGDTAFSAQPSLPPPVTAPCRWVTVHGGSAATSASGSAPLRPGTSLGEGAPGCGVASTAVTG